LGGGSISLEEFLNIRVGAFDKFSSNNANGSAITKLLSINSVNALTFNSDFIEAINDVSSVVAGNDILLLVTETNIDTCLLLSRQLVA